MAEGATEGKAADDINLAAAVLDQVFQARDETQVTLQTAQDIYIFLQTYTRALDATIQRLVTRLETHITAVEQRHKKMFERIDLNTRSREDAEWEISNLHSTMTTWHQHHVVMQTALIHALKALHLERDLQRLPAVPELPPRRPREREHGAKEAL